MNRQEQRVFFERMRYHGFKYLNGRFYRPYESAKTYFEALQWLNKITDKQNQATIRQYENQYFS